MCKISDAHLPSFFHIPFDIRAHPEPPHGPWLVPSKLYAEVNPKAAVNSHDRGASSYVQGRRSLLRFVAERKRHLLLLNENMKQNLGQSRVKNLVFRQDMHELVLGLLQDAVIRSLRWGLQHPKAGLIARCDEGVAAVEKIEGVGCLLYIDTTKNFKLLEEEFEKSVADCHTLVDQITKWERKQQRLGKRAADDPRTTFPPALNLAYSHPPAHFPMAQYKDKKIPVYSLKDMLGAKKVQELLKGTVFEDARALILREGNLTTNAQMLLLRLQGYLT
jgi:hypothetical protein